MSKPNSVTPHEFASRLLNCAQIKVALSGDPVVGSIWAKIARVDAGPPPQLVSHPILELKMNENEGDKQEERDQQIINRWFVILEVKTHGEIRRENVPFVAYWRKSWVTRPWLPVHLKVMYKTLVDSSNKIPLASWSSPVVSRSFRHQVWTPLSNLEN